MTQLASTGGDTAADQERPASAGATVPPEPYQLTDKALEVIARARAMNHAWL